MTEIRSGVTAILPERLAPIARLLVGECGYRVIPARGGELLALVKGEGDASETRVSIATGGIVGVVGNDTADVLALVQEAGALSPLELDARNQAHSAAWRLFRKLA